MNSYWIGYNIDKKLILISEDAGGDNWGIMFRETKGAHLNVYISLRIYCNGHFSYDNWRPKALQAGQDGHDLIYDGYYLLISGDEIVYLARRQDGLLEIYDDYFNSWTPAHGKAVDIIYLEEPI